MSLTSYHALTRAPEQGAPLIFAFHGTGGDEHQFFDLARRVRPDAGVVSLRGDVLEGGAARFFRRTGEGVYDMDDLAMRTARMGAFVAAHKDTHPGAPVYGFGYSNGANILASVVMERPDLFDRVGLLHPLIPWSPGPVDLTGRSVLITAGRQDPICPWPLSEALIDWANAQGAGVTTHIHEGGHELRPGEVEALSKLLSR
ncbi:alpha/beta hydrolase [Pseudosulfitobacter koreensis]|uniref:Alpha/beta hydrolase n=1 Tax=Pseudosulfitobacter koreensis TaxID=2968472 RepID=A0ABT1YY86_9RHOB|nr:alpha/beta hydrolase [Pseudosulfitobacter koreense]MCR8825847.1 alpha/beta hydrolase [Pseudosulfitobacter koreense]